MHLHRKIWEWCFICEALAERGMLRPDKHGLGLAVGQEPLTAMFARMVASILATDLFVDRAEEMGWVETGQHADSYDALNDRGLCDPKEFNRLVKFQFADMNDIGTGFDGQFDFLWSSCAFERKRPTAPRRRERGQVVADARSGSNSSSLLFGQAGNFSSVSRSQV